MLIKQTTMKSSEKGSSEPGNNLDNVDRNKKSQFLRDAKISAVTFDVNASSALEQKPTVDSSASQDTLSSSPSRKIGKDDIVQIFRLRSVTTSSVSREQVLRIRKVHDMISDGVKFNFNYVTFLHIASIVAALGLATDSSTTVISSMLLSPIMGPVIGMAYGVIIWDWPLIKRSVKIELISIILCLILGLIIGFSTYWTHMAYAWPTEEMYSRSSRHGFLAGIPIAFFSGMGVALSVLDDHVSSLVGVAISASLLPPAVNSGILAAMAIIRDDDWIEGDFEWTPDHFFSFQRFVPKVSALAFTSLLLTVFNVLFVSIGAIAMFRIKEVLPVEKTVFWSDLKVARRIYQGRARDDAGRVLARLSQDEAHDDPVETIVENE